VHGGRNLVPLKGSPRVTQPISYGFILRDHRLANALLTAVLGGFGLISLLPLWVFIASP
jgi:hypothetical protein